MRSPSTLILTALLSVSPLSRGAVAEDGGAAKSIVPTTGYEWPDNDREYWPTESWKSALPERHGLDPQRMAIADRTAEGDPFFRSLLVVKDGFLVFERFYHGGRQDQRSEVWSVTKSITSALVGIAYDRGYIRNTGELMADLLPDYPGFGKMTLEDVLTHRSGLAWDEASLEAWILSSDWNAEALSRGYVAEPGAEVLYSSGNSHFLSALIREVTGISPGDLAKQSLFDPLGIEFVAEDRTRLYTDWQELHEPIVGTWRQDNGGLEIGAFGLNLTAREMAKFGFLYLNRGIWEGKTILSASWVEESTRDHVLRSENVGLGYQWMVVRRAGAVAFDADGWGGQTISVIPALDMVIVTKCDAVDPRGRSSYRVLEEILEAVVD